MPETLLSFISPKFPQKNQNLCWYIQANLQTFEIYNQQLDLEHPGEAPVRGN